MKIITLLTFLVTVFAIAEAKADKAVHLFVLSGQSNMQGMDPETGFMTETKKLFKDEKVVYIKVAKGGQPICRWLEEWQDIAQKNGLEENHIKRIHRGGKVEFYQPILDQYKEMLKKHPKFESVTFCWMQGERDANGGAHAAYKDALKQLISNLRRDLKRPDMNIVIGRIGDYALDRPSCVAVRKAQREIANEDPRGAWVDVDDLNDREVDGVMQSVVHYNRPEGYDVLGQRFAGQGHALVTGREPAEDGRPGGGAKPKGKEKKEKAEERAEAEKSRPNILILYADDLGFGDLTSYNADSKIPTPHLDQLAAEGIRFTDGHSSSGICTPSRYALLTGRHHWRKGHGIVDSFGRSWFKAERLTLPEMLKEKGYHTAAIGKWHLGWNWNAVVKPGAVKVVVGRRKTYRPEDIDWSKPIPDGPLAHGFDHYFGDTVINFPPYCWIEDDKVVEVPDIISDTKLFKPIKEGGWGFRPGPMISGWDPYTNIPVTTERGVKYIHDQAKTDDPFFLYFAYPSPHVPIIPNDEFDGKSQAGPYGDFVVETDDSCGKLLQALKNSGQDKNTIVIFSADNGPAHYAYARDHKFDHWSSQPFRGLKRDVYEGGHRVPFIVKWPGVTKAGTVSDALVSQIDIMATIADFVGYKLPDDQAEDSHNLAPLLRGDVDAVRTTHIHNTTNTQYAIRHGDWVLIDAKEGYSKAHDEAEAWEEKHGYPDDDDQPAELFNLVEDIGQRNNLAAEHPERVAELQKLLKQIREQGYSAPRLAK